MFSNNIVVSFNVIYNGYQQQKIQMFCVCWEGQNIQIFINIRDIYPANTKHLYDIYTMLDQHWLVQRCTNVIQMFCVYWVASFACDLLTERLNSSTSESRSQTSSGRRDRWAMMRTVTKMGMRPVKSRESKRAKEKAWTRWSSHVASAKEGGGG